MNTPIPDSERIDVIAAERELSMLETFILANQELSEIAKESAIGRLQRVRKTVANFRARFGLAQ